MTISQILSKKTSFSFEFFPPKKEDSYNNLKQKLTKIKDISPDFISITYGAMGTTQDKTLDLVSFCQNDLNLTSMAHLTCVGASKDKIYEILTTLQERNIQNIMALRGDPPQNSTSFTPPKNGFSNANYLISFIKENFPSFSIGAAAYPEGHIESKSLDDDLIYIKKKQDNGASFFITQLFFDNNLYFDFIKKAEKMGITIPIIPGVMPIQSIQQMEKISKMCGTSIPNELRKSLDKFSNVDDIKKFGLEYALKMSQELILNKVAGIHFYTLNNSNTTIKIFEELKN